jgi:beta-N-acetylhexosaminidase
MRQSRPLAGLAVLSLLTGLAGLTGCSGGSPAGPEVRPARTQSESVAPTPSGSSCAANTLATLSLPERAGQVLLIGVPAQAPDQGVGVVTREHLAGVFLAGRSSASDRLRAAADGPGLLVAADQEGGLVQTFSGRGFTRIPAALQQGSWSQATLRSRTRAWGAGLADAGISLNLAPVADTVTRVRALENPPIGRFRREYGHTSTDVADAVATVVAALDDEKVLATVKHFPGLGRVRFNTDVSSLAEDGETTAADVYLRPFVAGIDAGAGAVMMSSARYQQLDSRSIAAFSRPIVTGLLRGQLGWDGVVMSDDLGRARAVSAVPLGERATRFIAAGGDLVLSVRTSDAKPMRTALVEKARASDTFTAQLDDAALRVLRLKERAGLLTC